MGLYDREYYREDHARREAWQVGPVTIALIVMTVAPFLIQLFTTDYREYGKWNDPLLEAGGFSADRILDGQVWRLVTPIFLQHPTNSIYLIAAGVAILLYCGRSVEGTYGPKEMFWYYVFTGIGGQLALLAVSIAKPLQFIPPEPGYGCGGSVAAVMVLFARLAPNESVPLIFGSIRASTLALIVVLVNVALFGYTKGAYFSAIPVLFGAAFAMAYHEYHWRVSNWIPDLPGLKRNQTAKNARNRERISSLENHSELETPQPPSAVAPPAKKSERVNSEPITNSNEQLEAELDRVLEKVAKTGKSSLTAEENALLLRASEIYKTRRK